jgi:two-component system KDP operon response regulator KdpE
MNQSSHEPRPDCLLEPVESADAGEASDRHISEASWAVMNPTRGIGPNGPVKGTVLVVEDEQSIGRSLQIILSRFHVAVVKAMRGEEAVSILRNSHVDAALVSINKHGMRGTDICRRLRKDSERLPILLIGDSNDEDKVLEAFEARADDYIAKPFRNRELIARLDAAIRRGRLCNSHGAVITVGDVSLDFSRHLAKKKGHPIHLTPTQFTLLHFLMTNLGKALPHTRLLTHVWGPEYGGELEYLRSFVRQLRKKIEDDPAKPKYLLTEWHFGYRFNEVA